MGTEVPELVDVLVAWGPIVERGTTLAAALERARRAARPPAVAAAEWAEARRWFDRVDEARRIGDWAALGKHMESFRNYSRGLAIRHVRLSRCGCVESTRCGGW